MRSRKMLLFSGLLVAVMRQNGRFMVKSVSARLDCFISTAMEEVLTWGKRTVCLVLLLANMPSLSQFVTRN